MPYSFETEKSEQLLVKNFIKEGMIVFDVGANDGNYSILFSELIGVTGKVFAFEPTPSAFSSLENRLKQFQCFNVTPINKAVYSENGVLEFNEFEEKYNRLNTLGKHPVMPDPENYNQCLPIIRTSTVEAITLDSFCDSFNIQRIDYLKIDVEGAESDVLKGLSHRLKTQSVGFIQFEISELPLKGIGRQAKDIFEILIQFRYECHRIEKDGAIGEKVCNSDSFYENYIAFPGLPIGFSHFNMFADRLSEKWESAESECEMLRCQLGELQDRLTSSQKEINFLSGEIRKRDTKIIKLQEKLNLKKEKLKQLRIKLENNEQSKLHPLSTVMSNLKKRGFSRLHKTWVIFKNLFNK